MRRFVLVVAVLSLVGTIGLVGHTRQALAASSPAAIGVTPALQNLVAQPGDSTLSYQVTVTNNSGQTLPITVSSNDFTTFGVNGTPAFLSLGQYNGAHSLAQAMVPSSPAFSLPAHASKALTISLQGLDSLATGGHYGALLFRTGAGSGQNSSGSNVVALNQTVASLVFLTTSGQGTYQLKLAAISSVPRLFSLPSQLNLLFSNTGNVQTTPRGYVNISNPLAKQLNKVVINPNSALVLPGTKRLLETPITTNSHPFWPGVYTVNIFYRADGAASFTVSSTKFFYVGWPILILIILVFSLVFIIRKKHIFRTRKSHK